MTGLKETQYRLVLVRETRSLADESTVRFEQLQENGKKYVFILNYYTYILSFK